ncbi:hypothetical protein LTR05_003092 [Lithohypha guttulata]|uniref:Uncharacterized protein n=1 Tax=Lithohypha guttulata TaxID=1690604 RepID=A0AAN7Y8P1_9EURO|nr:hypothetical protein LTR05_003092 [Lithohypha guttulata]
MRLDEIELEVLQIILQYVYNSVEGTLVPLAQVNKYFNEAMKVVLHSQKVFYLHNSIHQSLDANGRNKWTKTSAIDHVRHLRVEYNLPWETRPDFSIPSSYTLFTERFEPFNNFIRSIRSLKSLTWNAGPLPHTLLETLKISHPKARLKIWCYKRFQSGLDYLDPSEVALANFPNLTHIKFDTRHARSPLRPHSQAPNTYNHAAFRAIVSRSPSLEYAGLVLDDNAFLPDRSVFPESDTSDHKCRSLKSLTLDGSSFQLSKESLKELSTYIDISRLETYKFSRGITRLDYFTCAASMLPNIKHLSLNFATLRNNFHDNDNTIFVPAKEYLLNCSPLETVSLWSWSGVLTVEELLNRHGATLKTLQLHEKQASLSYDFGRSERTTLTAAQIQSLRAACPRLSDLTLDLNQENLGFDLRTQPETLDVLEIVSHFTPPLQKLQIYFDNNGLARYLQGKLTYDPSTGLHHHELDTPDEDQDEDEDEVEDEDNNEVDGRTTLASSTGPASTHSSLVELTAIHSPLRKRARRDGNTSESVESASGGMNREQVLRNYVESIWKCVFGTATTGQRSLEVKFGEVESRSSVVVDTAKGHFLAYPHVRDDKLGECTIRKSTINYKW